MNWNCKFPNSKCEGHALQFEGTCKYGEVVEVHRATVWAGRPLSRGGEGGACPEHRITEATHGQCRSRAEHWALGAQPPAGLPPQPRSPEHHIGETDLSSLSLHKKPMATTSRRGADTVAFPKAFYFTGSIRPENPGGMDDKCGQGRSVRVVHFTTLKSLALVRKLLIP